MGTFTYENEHNGDVVTFDEPHERLEGLDNWHRVSGDAPAGDAEHDEQIEEMTPEEMAAELAAADDETVLSIYNAALNEGISRGLITENVNDEEADAHDAGGSEQPVDPEPAVEAKGGSEGEPEPEPTKPGRQTQTEATEAAIDLAKAEDIDLGTVEGTGKDGLVTVGDVRKAVEAKGGSEG